MGLPAVLPLAGRKGTLACLHVFEIPVDSMVGDLFVGKTNLAYIMRVSERQSLV